MANAQVNELVAMQAEMLLKAAEVRSSCSYWDPTNAGCVG